MALVSFNTYVGEVAPHVQGVPTPVLVSYIRRAMIDLCERAKVWRVDLTDVPLVAGTYAYAIASPIAGTEVSAFLDAKLKKASDTTSRTPLEITTQEVVLATVPDWPNLSTPGEPRAVFRDTSGFFDVAPVPDTLDTYTIALQAAIRPTAAATTVEDTLMSDYYKVWFHGAIHALMVMPGRVWSNEKLALYHGKQWEFYLNNARAKANKGFSRAPIYVQQRPWA